MTVAADWTRHRPLARKLARDWTIPGYERQDVEQEALIGLWAAARNWRPDGGAAFTTFARHVITCRLTDALKAATRGKHRPLNLSARVGADGEESVASLPHLHQVADVAEDRERLAAVLAAIDRDLTVFERRCVIGVASGLSYAEIGESKRVDNALVQARAKLRAV